MRMPEGTQPQYLQKRQPRARATAHHRKLYTHTHLQGGPNAAPTNSRTRRILAARSPARHAQKRKPHHQENSRSRPRRQSRLPTRSLFQNRHRPGAPHRRRRNALPRNHHQRRISRHRRIARQRQDAYRSRRLVFRKLRAQFRKAHATERRSPRQNHRLPRHLQAPRRRLRASRDEPQHPPSWPTLQLLALHGRQSPLHLRRKLRRRPSPQSRPSLIPRRGASTPRRSGLVPNPYLLGPRKEPLPSTGEEFADAVLNRKTQLSPGNFAAGWEE